jgi:hypothetical protein
MLYSKLTLGALWTGSAAVLLALTLSSTRELSDQALSGYRGADPELYSLGCLTCGGVNAGGQGVDPCVCSTHVGQYCIYCSGATEGSQDVVMNEGWGGPGWYWGDPISCNPDSTRGNEMQAKCAADGTCSACVPISIGTCNTNLDFFGMET